MKQQLQRLMETRNPDEQTSEEIEEIEEEIVKEKKKKDKKSLKKTDNKEVDKENILKSMKDGEIGEISEDIIIDLFKRKDTNIFSDKEINLIKQLLENQIKSRYKLLLLKKKMSERSMSNRRHNKEKEQKLMNENQRNQENLFDNKRLLDLLELLIKNLSQDPSKKDSLKLLNDKLIGYIEDLKNTSTTNSTTEQNYIDLLKNVHSQISNVDNSKSKSKKKSVKKNKLKKEKKKSEKKIKKKRKES